MSEFARYLVAAGIASTQFSAIARQAYFLAASSDAKFRNNRINQSAVAAMTGLTRAQVRGYAKHDRPKRPRKLDRMENIVLGWNADPAFTTSDYLPRRLAITGKKASFAQLVRKYGGDVPARSILREMVRIGLVTTRGKFVCLARKGRHTNGQAQLRNVSQHLTQLISHSGTPASMASSLPAMVREVTFPSTSSKGRALLQKKTEEGLQAFMSELRAAGYAASIEAPERLSGAPRVIRSRVMILTEELTPTGQKLDQRE